MLGKIDIKRRRTAITLGSRCGPLVVISPRSCQTIVVCGCYPQRAEANSETTIWESNMGAVMVRCPDTGREIPTGIVADRRSFNSTPVFFGRVYCPLCRAEHEWFAKE